MTWPEVGKPQRFVLFAGDTYYPSGGWDDFRGSFHTKEEAERAAKEGWTRDHPMWTGKYDWTQIIDLETGEEV